jgi:SPP1 gp7 family putative phage head morphogenesis protein
MVSDEERRRIIDSSVDQFIDKATGEILGSVVPAYIKGNLQTQTYEKIRPSFGIAQDSARNWFADYRTGLEDKGGGVIDGEFVPWLKEWDTELREKLTDVIDTSIDEGWSTDETSDSIQELLGVESARGDRIARTEIARAMFYGRMDRIRQGGYTMVRWKTAPDRADVEACDDCKALDRLVFPIDDFPEQPLHPNCRCTCSPVLSSLAFPGEKPPGEIPALPQPVTPTTPAGMREAALNTVKAGMIVRSEIKTLMIDSGDQLVGLRTRLREVEGLRYRLSTEIMKTETGTHQYNELMKQYDALEPEMNALKAKDKMIVDDITNTKIKLAELESKIKVKFIAELAKVLPPEPAEPAKGPDILYGYKGLRNGLSEGTIDKNYITWKDRLVNSVKVINKLARSSALRALQIQVVPVKIPGRRSFFSTAENKEYLDVRDTREFVGRHETGHLWENNNDCVRTIARNLIASRAGKIELLNTIAKKQGTNDTDFKADEMGLVDWSRAKPTDPYEFRRSMFYGGKVYLRTQIGTYGDGSPAYTSVGRIRDIPADWEMTPDTSLTSTEVMSAGVELMITDPVRFAIRDPDWFDAVTRAMTTC